MQDHNTDRSRQRLKRLRVLADDYALTRDPRTRAGAAVDADLSRPERLARWCAVTYLTDERSAYLDPHHPTAASARRRTERLLGDSPPEELPLEVVDLDSGARQIARLGVLGWDTPSH